MRNSFSSSDQITINLKTKTNSSGINQYSKKQLNNFIADERPDTIESSINYNGRQPKRWYGLPGSSNKLVKKPSQPNVIPQNLTHQPISPNSKRLQQLQLFRFDDKIQQIQSQQIQQLINQQINASKNKELQKISQLLNKSPIHPNNSNAFRLFKRSSNRVSKGQMSMGNDSNATRYGNNTFQGNQQANTKIGSFMTHNQPSKNNSQIIQNKKHSKSIIVLQNKKTQGDIEKYKIQTNFKQTASLPVWQRNIFYQKVISRQNQSKHPIYKTYFSSTSQNASFFRKSPEKNTQTPKKLSQIQQSLTFLKNKSFSIKKNYQFFISKLNSSNPEVQQQLMDELQKSKMNERFLFDSNCKSFSGYCKLKSYMYNKERAQEKMRADMMTQNDESGCDLYRNATNITSYKFSNYKSMKLKLSKKNKNQLLLFDEGSEPKLRRLMLKQDQEDSQNQDEQSEFGILPKFRELYKDKHDQKQIEKYIAERQRISRQASSPYHELSAWN